MAAARRFLLCIALSAYWLEVESSLLVAETRVPAWNARGTGPLPRQGAVCLDISPDGSRIAIGTMAPPGERNVIVLDSQGKLVESWAVGERWINQVVLGNEGQLHAVCTMPAGKSGDVPTIYSCRKQPEPIPNGLGEAGYARVLFHYGEHSNHPGIHIVGTDYGHVGVYSNRLLWFDQTGVASRDSMQIPWAGDSVATALAAHRNGAVVFGCSALRAAAENSEPNLFLAFPGDKQPRWSRDSNFSVPAPPAAEKGLYGTPTLRDGRREELPQHDLPVVAPLSIAVNREPVLSRIATADSAGWQRWIKSSATGREQNYGTRFMPGKPVISVYDEAGKLVRRFDSELFAKPGWFDLAFLPGAKQLVAHPHRWASRGLGGQPHLPTDDNANTLWLLDIEQGDVQGTKFPDAIADVAIADHGQVAVSCWNGKLYLLDAAQLQAGKLPHGVELGGPAVIQNQPGNSGWVAANNRGVVHFLNADGKTLKSIDLEKLMPAQSKPWVQNARAEKIEEGLWQLSGGRVESDLGGQRVIEGPDGLILIEGHAGLSMEREWAAMEKAGLDPRRIKYVLATHEHGDHAPGSYLWRVVTGAQFVCSEPMAYSLQHHLPICSGYGLHPPVPTDIRIAEDRDLDLAGVKVRALRIPGHTFGSMGWLIERGGKKYVAIGDLIMPDGVLGYAGSINFSATDILASLRKLDDLHADFILPGHGPITSPERYLAAGIGVGRHVGWGKIVPEAPDSRYRLDQSNVLVVAWNIDATSADFGDVNGDQLPDVAVVTPHESGSTIKIFLNQRGKFAAKPDQVLEVDSVTDPTKLRIRELNGDGRADFFVAGKSAALLLSKKSFPHFEARALGLGDGNQARRLKLAADQSEAIAVNTRFGAFQRVHQPVMGRARTTEIQPRIYGPYADVWTGDLNRDGRADLVTSTGQVHVRAANGSLPLEPNISLPLPVEKDWSFLAVGDFSGDGLPDVALTSYQAETLKAVVYTNSGDTALPFSTSANTTLDLKDKSGDRRQQHPLLRDTVAVADWNGDGIDDLIIGKGQDSEVSIWYGARGAMAAEPSERISLNFRLHYETGLTVADFNGDGKLDLAALGYTNTGVGSTGPLAAYIYLREK